MWNFIKFMFCSTTIVGQFASYCGDDSKLESIYKSQNSGMTYYLNQNSESFRQLNVSNHDRLTNFNAVSGQYNDSSTVKTQSQLNFDCSSGQFYFEN